jgi:hypothetical protein
MRKKFAHILCFLIGFFIGYYFFNDIPIFLLPILIVLLGLLLDKISGD